MRLTVCNQLDFSTANAYLNMCPVLTKFAMIIVSVMSVLFFNFIPLQSSVKPYHRPSSRHRTFFGTSAHHDCGGEYFFSRSYSHFDSEVLTFTTALWGTPLDHRRRYSFDDVSFLFVKLDDLQSHKARNIISASASNVFWLLSTWQGKTFFFPTCTVRLTSHLWRGYRILI